MQVEIKIDSSHTVPKVIILTASITDDVNNIVKKLSEDATQIISGYKDEKIEILEQADLSGSMQIPVKYLQLPQRGSIFCVFDYMN